MPKGMYRKIKHIEYPEAKTYTGKAQRIFIDLKAPFGALVKKLDWLISNIIEFYTRKKGGKMLRLAIYDLGEVPGPLGLSWRRYNIVWFVHTSPAIGIAVAILGAVAAVLISVGWVILAKKVSEIDWGEAMEKVKPISRYIMIGLGFLAAMLIIPPLLPRGD